MTTNILYKQLPNELPGPNGVISFVDLAAETLPDIHEYDVGPCGIKDIVLTPEHHGISTLKKLSKQLLLKKMSMGSILTILVI